MEPGDVTASALLAQRGWVRALARTLVRDRDDADDVEQETWLVALRRPPRASGSLRAWFASVVRSRARDRVRMESRRAAREDASARSESVASAADVAATTEIHRRLAAAIFALDEPCRSAVILRYFEDLPPREVAARTGVPVETARTRIKRGIERLRERLDEENRGDRRAWIALVAPLADGRPRGAAWTGGTIVATKKTAVLAALLLLAIGGGWIAWTNSMDRASPRAASHVASAGGARPVVARARERSAPATDATAPVATAAVDDPNSRTKPDHPILALVDSVTGKPPAGAEVSIVWGNHSYAWDDHPDGRYDAQSSLLGATVTLWASAPGHAQRRITDVVLAAEIRTIALDPCEPLRLSFVTESGRALGADEVRARFGEKIPFGTFEIVADDAIRGGDVPRMLRLLFGGGDWSCELSSDCDGAPLRLADGLAAGRWRLFVRRPGATPWMSEPFESDGRSAATVVVPLPETPRTKRVRLVAADTNEALADARVIPFYGIGDDRAYLRGTVLRADAQGFATLPYDPPTLRGGARPPTWWAWSAPGHLGEIPARLFDDADADQTIEFAVPRSVVVEGEARLPSGEPAVGAVVLTGRDGMLRSARIDAAGRFRITDVALLDGSVTVLMPVGDAFEQASAPVGDDGVARVIIGPKSPTASAQIAGVVTAGGRPLAGLFVVDQPVGAKGGFVRSDADGRFVLDGLDATVAHDLVVYLGDPQADDSFHRVRTTTPLRLDASKPLAFAFDLPAGAVRVKAIDAETGAPIAAARVVGGPADRSIDATRFAGFDLRVGWAGFTADDGTLLLRALPTATSNVVRVDAAGYEPATRDGVVPGTIDAPADAEVRLAKKK